MIEFKLPDIGEGTVEGEIVRWLVKPGDKVKADQPVVEVMTDKATVELTAPKAGVIKELKAEAGKIAKVGSVIYTLDDAGGGGGNGAGGDGAKGAPAKEKEQKAPAQQQPQKAKAEARAPQEAATAGQRGMAATEQQEVEAARGGGAKARGGASSTAVEEPEAPARKPLATPATRRLAREMGVDIATVRGSGPSGRVTDDDVRGAAEGAAAPATAPRPAVQKAFEATEPKVAPRTAAHVSGDEAVERIPFRGLRKAIAEQMKRSKYTATHYTYVEEVDMTEVVSFRDEVKEEAKKKGVKLTFLPFIAKAVCAALKKHPMLNSELDEKSQEIILKKYYHLGFSIQTDPGLMVGVVKHADKRSLFDLAAELERLVSSFRAGKGKPEDMKGSTFTITSAGNIGGVFATPVINFPEVAILGVNQIKKRPVVKTNEDGEDEILIRHMMFLSISLDHRIVDGAVAAQFMNDVVYLLEDPRRLLLEA
jgi:pyruvate dehydrogenase E2 component (dihydrolipoamide acetyltransferase)